MITYRAKVCPGDALRGWGPMWSSDLALWVPGCGRRPVQGYVVLFQLAGGDWGRLLLPMCSAHVLESPEEFAAARLRVKHSGGPVLRVEGLRPEFAMLPIGEPVQEWIVVRPAA